MLLLGELSLWQTFYEAFKEDQLCWTGWAWGGTEGLRTKLSSTNSVPSHSPLWIFARNKKNISHTDNFLIKLCRISFYFLHFPSHGEVIKCAATWIMGDNDNIPSDYCKHSPSDEKQNFIQSLLQSLKLTRSYQAKTFTITLSTAS